MPDVRSSARRLLRRAAGAATGPEPIPGEPAVTTGAAAAERLEALLPGAAAVPSADPRGALSAALGLAAAGLRVAPRLAAANLAANLDLVADAAAHRLPLVVHVGLDGDHGPWHAAAATGAVQLLAADAQQAVDLTLAARRVAEEALTPVLLAMDRETAAGVRDVALPDAGLVRRYLGAPDQVVHSSGAAQEQLLGRHRRRLFPWHEPGRPLAAGAPLPPEAATAAGAGRRAYLDPQVSSALDTALTELATLTGRPLAPLATWRTDGARVVLVVQGAAVETVRAVAEATAGGALTELLAGRKVGVVGLTALRPLPAEELAVAVGGADLALVLERSDAPLDGDGPLTREVAAALQRVSERHRPRLATVVHGLGGAPLRAADLAALLETVHGKPTPGAEVAVPRYLGVDLDPAGEPWPKRRVVLDALRRDYPQARRLGLAGRGPAPELRPEGAHTVAVHAGGPGPSPLGDLAALLHRLAGGHLRGTTDPAPETWGSDRTDLLTWAPTPCAAPGADVTVDTLVWTATAAPPTAEALASLAEGGAVVFVQTGDGWRRPLSEDALRLAEERKIRWFAVPAAVGDALFLQHRERLLGASLGVLAAAGRHSFPGLPPKPRKLQEAGRALLLEAGLDDAEVEERVTALLAGLDRVHEAKLDDLDAAPPAARQAAAAPPEIPAVVRDAAVPEPGRATVDSLPRFWDQVTGPRRLGDGTLLADPQLATGVLPARTAALATTAPARETLPVFHPDLCTGCGACWTACPDGAVGPVAVGTRALLEAAMNRASAGALRSVLGKLAPALDGELAAAAGRSTAELLDAAYDASVAGMPLPDERKAKVRQAFEAVRDELAPLPLTRTELLGDVPFTLALDPDACKGCGLCVAVCEPEALTAEPDTPQRSRDARRLWQLAADLPAPEAGTLERVREGADDGPLAAALLPAAHRAVLTGADGAAAGDGASLAVRQTLAVAAEALAPRRAELLRRLEERSEELATAIQGALSRALPSRDLDALARGLDALDRSEAELTDLIGRVEAAFDSDRVDVPRLRHLVDAARELADLTWRLSHGESGRGQSLFSVVVGPGPQTAGMISWPANPWSVPVTVAAGGDAAARARGVLAGQLHHATGVARALRRAALELEAVDRKRTGGPAAEERLEEELERLSRLGWHDLEADERALCPPLFLVAGDAALLGTSLPGLADLLRDDLPVKVLLLADEPGAEPPLAVPTLHARCSVAHGAQLHGAVSAALDHDGPALLHVLAPSPRRAGLPADATLERARQTVAAGEWELSLHRPGQEGGSEDEPATVPSEEVAALRREHKAELARLRAEHEQHLAALRGEVRGELAQQVRARLLRLALRRRNGEETTETGEPAS